MVILASPNKGGDSPYGSGGIAIMGNAASYQATGNAATGFGAGGGGGLSNQSGASNIAGGNGSSGLLIITEYLAQ